MLAKYTEWVTSKANADGKLEKGKTSLEVKFGLPESGVKLGDTCNISPSCSTFGCSDSLPVSNADESLRKK